MPLLIVTLESRWWGNVSSIQHYSLNFFQKAISVDTDIALTITLHRINETVYLRTVLFRTETTSRHARKYDCNLVYVGSSNVWPYAGNEHCEARLQDNDAGLLFKIKVPHSS